MLSAEVAQRMLKVKNFATCESLKFIVLSYFNFSLEFCVGCLGENKVRC